MPVGVGQSRRLLDLIPRLGITAIFGTLSFPAHLAAARASAESTRRALGLRHIVTAGEPGAGLARRARARSRRRGTPRSPTAFGMSDVWSTMAGECGEGEGLHLTAGEPRACSSWSTPTTGEPLPLEDGVERRARVDAPAPRGLAAAALPLGRPRPRLDDALRLRPRHAAHPHRRPPRRHAARAGGRTSTRRRSARCSADPGSGATRRRRRRPDRPAAARLRRGAGDVDLDGDRRRAARRPARRFARHAARARVAPGGRAQDADRPPNGARRRCQPRGHARGAP